MVGGDRPQRDTWTVKTTLRPDFYEFFPVFSPEELDARLTLLPFCRATLLTERNIRRARTLGAAADRGFQRFLGASVERQQRRLADVLESVGLSTRVVSAIASVPRHLFAPASGARFAYLNTHLPTAPGSCLTPPGLVAVMLDEFDLLPGTDIAEFGAGSGYHLACAAHLIGPHGRALGIDVQFPPDARQDATGTARVRANMFSAPLREACVDALYATCYIPTPLVRLAEFVRPQGAVQYVCALTRTEFESEPAHSWLRTAFANYEDYLKAEPQRYCVVRTHRIGDSGELEEAHPIYDVSFVSAFDPGAAPPSIRELEFR